MKISSYPSESNPDNTVSRYAHPIFWWVIKVVCGATLIASLFLMVIYQLPVLFKIPVIAAQAMVIVGASISLWHYWLLKKGSDNMSVPKALMSEQGLFPWIRHPMYLADMIAYTGLFLLMPNALTAIILLIAYIALFRQAQAEDSYMASRFESKFQTWRSSSKLIFPYIY